MRLKWTDQQVVDALRDDSALNRARKAFSSACGRIDQDSRQRNPSGPIEIRRMEFEAVFAIAKELGIELKNPY